MTAHYIAVIPAKDEAPTIASVVKAALVQVADVYVIDDTSHDETAQAAAAAGARVFTLSNATGYSAALLHGLRCALEAGADGVVMLDADGAHDPADIGRLLECHAKTSAGLVIGNRFHSDSTHEIPSTKRWANFFATAVVNAVLGLTMQDVACGLRLLSPAYAEKLLEAGPMPGFSLAFVCLEVARRQGHDIAQPGVSVRYNAAEFACTTQYEFTDLLSTCRMLLPRGSRLDQPLASLQNLVARHAPATVEIGGRTLCLHPVPGGYVFQHQLAFFADRTGPLIEFSVDISP